MTDQQAFIEAIRTNPDDDVPRLAFADWLEENARTVPCGACGGRGYPEYPRPSFDGRETTASDGTQTRHARVPPFNVKAILPCPACSGHGVVSDGRRERSEFIRIQVELAEPAGCDLAERSHLSCGDLTPGRSGQPPPCPRCVRTDALWLRERELFATHRDWWFPVPPGHGFDWNIRLATDPADDRPEHVVSRGFLAELRGPLAAFWGERDCEACSGSGEYTGGPAPCSHCSGTGRVSGPTPAFVALARREPLTPEGIFVTDREPEDMGGVWHWNARNDDLPDDGEPSRLPAALLRLMAGDYGDDPNLWIWWRRYDAKAAARLALGRGLLGAAVCRFEELRRGREADGRNYR